MVSNQHARSTPYIRIRPTTDPIDSETAASQFQRLHRLAEPADTRSTTRRLLLPSSPPTPSTIEFLLVATPDDAVEYLLTLHGDNDESNPATLEPVLRNTLPDTYEFEDRTVVLDDILGLDSHSENASDTPAES